MQSAQRTTENSPAIIAGNVRRVFISVREADGRVWRKHSVARFTGFRSLS